MERTAPVHADGSYLLLRVPAGNYRVEELLRGRVERALVLTVEIGAVAEVGLSQGAPDAANATRDWSDEEAVDVADQTSEDERGADATELQGRGEPRPSAAPLLSFRGLAPTQNATLLDGLSGQQAFRSGERGNAAGGARGQASFAATGALRIRSLGFSAQYGGGGGGMQVATTERGSSADSSPHGSFEYQVRSSAFAATNPFAIATHYHDGGITTAYVKPTDLDQVFSGRIGGGLAFAPWLRSRVAGIAAVELGRRSFPAQSSPATASFYALTPSQTALLANRGVTATARNDALNYLDSLTGTVDRRSDRGVESARLDGRFGARDLAAVSYTRSRLSAPAGTGAGAATAVIARGMASVGNETVRLDALGGQWLHLFGGTGTGVFGSNELRSQYARDFEFESARPPLAAEPAISPGGFAPQVAIYDGSGGGAAFAYGTPAGLGRRAYPDERRLELADVAQVSAGRHLFTFGGDWSRVAERIDALTDEDGSYIYDSALGTGGRDGGLVDWITDYTFNVRTIPNGGCPSINAATHFFCFRSFSQSFGQSAVQFVEHELAVFAQDLWRVRPGLTVEAGVRYEYVLLPLPQRPNPALDAVFTGFGSTSSFPEDRNNAGPRLAVAWAPHQGVWGTVHLGYGAFAGRLPGTTVRAALVDTALAASATHVRITPETVTGCPQVANQGFGFPCAYVSAPPAAVAATTSAVVLARGFRLPMVQVAELTLERGWRGVDVRAGYSGAWATQLAKSTDINVAPASGLGHFLLQGGDGRAGVRDGETFVVPVYGGRVSPQYGPVTGVVSNANATWHALTVAARARVPGGLTARGSYTWSKALDDAAEQGATIRRNGQFDPFDGRYDKGIADANVPHRFSGDIAWSTHLARGPRWVQQAASQWRLVASGAAESGRAYSYQVFGGTHLSGGAYSLNGSGGLAYLPTVGRNTLRMPARWHVDARVARGFRMTDGLRGEAFAEAANVTNHVSAARVNDRAFIAGTPVNGVTPLVFQDAAAVAAAGAATLPFGAVTSSTIAGEGERRVRLGLRVQF